MAGKIPSQFVDELLSRVDIVEIISPRVHLRKSGMNHFACCPFHHESTASFSVSQSKQFYYCFGCGASGNAVTFLMEYERMNFVEAIETLASISGVSLPKTVLETVGSEPEFGLSSKCYHLLARVARYYQHLLKHHELGPRAIEYLKYRGLTGEICKQYAIGFAPPGWDTIIPQFARDKQAKEVLEATGMVIRNQNKNSLYDRFRNRIMFPIRDPRGRVIGFGGRVLDDSTPKYLNTPETAIFHKGKALYGLYELLQSGRHFPEILVVEGYMDVVSLAQFGIDNVVATLGTATSKEHFKQLFRYCNTVVCCFDGDKAGRDAAWRALQVALTVLSDGREVKFLFLKEGYDPDDTVREIGVEAFQQFMAGAVSISEYLFQHLNEEATLSTIEGRAKFAKSALDLIARVAPGALPQLLLAKLSRIVNMDRDQIQQLLSKVAKRDKEEKVVVHHPISDVHKTPLRVAIALLIHNPALISALDNIALLRQIHTQPGIALLLALIDLIKQYPQITPGRILEHWRESPYEKHLQKLAALIPEIPESGYAEEFKGAIRALIKDSQETKIEHLLAKANIETLSQAEKVELQQLLAKSRVPGNEENTQDSV